MCWCTPEIRTPFCGKGECKWPEYKQGQLPILEVENIHLKVNDVDYIRLDYHRITVSELEALREILNDIKNKIKDLKI